MVTDMFLTKLGQANGAKMLPADELSSYAKHYREQKASARKKLT